jgi:hypothetical protein
VLLRSVSDFHSSKYTFYHAYTFTHTHIHTHLHTGARHPWRRLSTLQLTCLALVAVLLLAMAVPAPVDAAATELMHAYGGASSDKVYSVVVHSLDNGFAMGGSSYSIGAGSSDALIIKTDSVGVEMWTKTYGGTNGDDSYSMIEHSIDQGFVLAGMTESYGAGASPSVNHYFLLVKTDSVGVEMWTKTFGGTNWDTGYSVIEVSFGNLVMAGVTRSHGAGGEDVILIKTDTVGVEVWTKTLGGSGQDEGAACVIEHSIDNGLAIAGYISASIGAGPFDILLIKTSFVGNELWAKTYGGAGSYDVTKCVIEHSIDNGFVLAGFSDTFGAGQTDFLFIKTDSVGVVSWTKTYGGSTHDYGWSVIEHSFDQGLVFVGDSDSVGVGGEDVLVVKTDTVGLTQWAKSFGGPGTSKGTTLDNGRSVVEHPTDGLVVAGWTWAYGE